MTWRPLRDPNDPRTWETDELPGGLQAAQTRARRAALAGDLRGTLVFRLVANEIRNEMNRRARVPA